MADSVNMTLWNRFRETDPAHTKKVEFGRKFTSIDAHWQIMRVTEELGPVGCGWGYRVDHSVENLSAAIPSLILAVADVTIWWRHSGYGQGQHSYGPVRGTSPLVENDRSGKPRLDDDAPKKATTDALTKGLSHLGVSADVFLGLYDDNKYVQRLQIKSSALQLEQAGSVPEAARKLLGKLLDAATEEAVRKLWADNEAETAKHPPAVQSLLRLRFGERVAQIKGRQEAA
jgi:hypothetical protein